MYEILKKVSRDIIYHKTSLNKQIRPRMHVAMVIVLMLSLCFDESYVVGLHYNVMQWYIFRSFGFFLNIEQNVKHKIT